MLIIPDITIISTWLKNLNAIFNLSTERNTIELIYLQKVNGISNADISLIDDIMTISIYSPVKQIALPALFTEISQINSATFLAKVYLELRDNENARIVFSYSISLSEGITFNQFSLCLSRFEEEALQVITELDSCDLLLNSLETSALLTFNNLNTYH